MHSKLASTSVHQVSTLMTRFPGRVYLYGHNLIRSLMTLVAMVRFILLLLLPVLVSSSGEGNIKLLENEVAVALKACELPTNDVNTNSSHRQRRSENYPRIDNARQLNQYGHERRNNSNMKEQNMLTLNATDYDYGSGNGEKFLTSTPWTTSYNFSNITVDSNVTNRTRRSEPLLTKPDNDQCLSQCVFANLQVVDSRGIPREAELWNVVQSSVTSQQSRTAARDQVQACFQELQSEAEDDGCAYSNKLERCLMLRFADRKNNGNTTKTPSN